MDIRGVPGTTLANETRGETIYTPPEGKALLREFMANWEQFFHNQTAVEPLLRMAVTHYQFEVIHPFTDGNSRAGRVLNLLFSQKQKLLDIPILYLSRYIIQNKSRYYHYLLKITTQKHWQQWILYVLDAVEQVSIWTREKIAAIRQLTDHTAEYVGRQTAIHLQPRISGINLCATI